ncbi:LOW QUALITY PROTEIN: hypothetical protein CVT26_016026 [Gymnopilus dilepis]|uniref:Uncharacterized protein n=1 Tax=Gymnopilus dilepis TaxID=231916 RepID=A0A409YDS9_9AGAR|nr:LOW QUALITY PROTEIN: hypothetical protein CVT26_016026 [Gymnopilus dilepis]
MPASKDVFFGSPLSFGSGSGLHIADAYTPFSSSTLSESFFTEAHTPISKANLAAHLCLTPILCCNLEVTRFYSNFGAHISRATVREELQPGLSLEEGGERLCDMIDAALELQAPLMV